MHREHEKITNLSPSSEYGRTIAKVSTVALIANFFLFAVTAVFGLIFANLSVLSDAVHSCIDFLTSFLIIATAFLISPKSDKKHNYGHEKVESFVTLVVVLILAGVASLLIWQGIESIISPEDSELNFYLISVTVLSVVIKEAMFWYQLHYAKKINSAVLKADAWHSRSDSLSSIAVLIGLISGIFLKTNILESVAVLIVAIMILDITFDILKSAISQLIDTAASEETVSKIHDIVKATKGVEVIISLKTRLFGNSVYADLEIAVKPDLTVKSSYSIVKAIQNTLAAAPDLRIKHCTVQINPET